MKPQALRGRPDWRALTVGIGLIAIAAIIERDAGQQTITATYGMGPAAMPHVVSVMLAVLGVGHLITAFLGGLPVPDEGDPIAVGWIALGLASLLGCIAFGGGFILATTLLFALTARAFGRRALFADLAIGLALGVAIHLLFAKILTLSLPAGPIERLF